MSASNLVEDGVDLFPARMAMNSPYQPVLQCKKHTCISTEQGRFETPIAVIQLSSLNGSSVPQLGH